VGVNIKINLCLHSMDLCPNCATWRSYLQASSHNVRAGADDGSVVSKLSHSCIANSRKHSNSSTQNFHMQFYEAFGPVVCAAEADRGRGRPGATQFLSNHLSKANFLLLMLSAGHRLANSKLPTATILS
jgi:hypothetical protein